MAAALVAVTATPARANAGEAVLIMAQGLLMYFAPDDVHRLLRACAQRFRRPGPLGWLPANVHRIPVHRIPVRRGRRAGVVRLRFGWGRVGR